MVTPNCTGGNSAQQPKLIKGVKMEIVCKHCSKTFEGRKDALYCSDACRKAHKRNTGFPEPNSQPQLELKQLRADLEASRYKAGIFQEMLKEFLQDHPHLVATITGDYFGRIIERRRSQGEARQLEEHFNYRPDNGQSADK
jgi:hypothetical protein